jgi:hypothetical protein
LVRGIYEGTYKTMKLHHNPTIDTFISYQTSDKIIAGKLKNVLSAFDINSFLAHEDLDVSVEWQNEILKKLREATLFICLLSKNYLNSYYCLQESGIAIMLDIPIIPLSLDGTTPPGFIKKYQAGKIVQESLSIKDIIPALLRHSKNIGIQIVCELMKSSGTFRAAETNFELIIPVLDDLSKSQAENILDIILDNSQITNAAKCLSDYLPKFLQKCSDKLLKEKIRKLKRIIRIL